MNGEERLIVSTVRRGSQLSESGRVLCLETGTAEPLWEAAVGPATIQADPNPRGNARGGRGIAQLSPDHIVVGVYDGLQLRDLRSGELQHVYSTHNMCGIHEIEALNAKQVAISSTSMDSVVIFDLEEGKEVDHYPLGTGPHPDFRQDNRAYYLDRNRNSPGHRHINSVTSHQGQLVALANRTGEILDVESGRVLARDPLLDRPHSLVARDNRLSVVNTGRGSVVTYDLDRSRVEVDVLRSPGFRRRYWRNRAAERTRSVGSRLGGSPPLGSPNFARGLAVSDDRIYVGTSPATVVEASLTSGSVRTLVLSRRWEEAVHGLHLIDAANA